MEMLEENCQCGWTCVIAALALGILLILKNKYIRFQLKFLSFVSTLSLASFGTIPFFAFNLPHVKNSWTAIYVHTTLGWISKMLGITWEMRNQEILAEEKGCVIVANHQSSLDVLAMMYKWVELGKWAAVARKELFYVWPYGLVAWLGGTVFIDRFQPAKAKEQLKLAVKRINDKTKLWFFPEGTRNRDGGYFLPFKKGAFHIAISCQVPIIPIVISPYHFISEKNHEFGTGNVVMKVLPPIPTEGLTLDNIDDLMERTRSIMLETYYELSKEVKEVKASG